jgi:dCTP deaminase
MWFVFMRTRIHVVILHPLIYLALGVCANLWRCPLMGVLSDYEIERDIKIEPFSRAQSQAGVISYGVSSYGYDVRVGSHYKVFTNVHSAIVDPKKFSSASFVDITADSCLIPPNSFALAETVEWLEIPRDVIAICVGKSTYARCGIIVNVTPLEPEWRGKVTLEISNTTPLPAKIYSNEGIAQIVFLRAEHVCETSYADKRGKYQDQTGLTLPKVVGA